MSTIKKSTYRYDILSAQEESNHDPGSVSSGYGDPGGVSYGLYQLSSNAGSVEPFINYCIEINYYAGEHLRNAGTPGLEPFSNTWRQIAAEDPEGFSEVQYQYAYERYFLEGVSRASQAGIDLNKHSNALKCVVWSAAVHYGPYWCKQLFEEAALELGMQNASTLDEIKYDRSLIEAIYMVRSIDSWMEAVTDEEIKESLRNRMTRECAGALRLLQIDGGAQADMIINAVNTSRGGVNRNPAKPGFIAGPKPSDGGIKTTYKNHGKHVDSIMTKLPDGKTFCEPINPDLVTVSNVFPQWALDAMQIDTSNLKRDENQAVIIPTDLIKQALGSEAEAFLGNADEVQKRQRIFDPDKYQEEFKATNTGKPSNNNDPYPVDLKIEEFEMHQPRVKVYSITCCPEAVPVAVKVLEATDAAEKRIVRLENNIATLLRYVNRLSTRMNINCVYYGGQTPFEKYKAIRCLHDDRIDDGQSMSLDQCLNCTRYEPIIGQIYEIMNDTGANMQAILDDNQMHYATMPEYATLSAIDKMHDKIPEAVLDLTKIQSRAEGEYDFKDYWPPGVEVSWDLVPVEEQKAHINWRQSILDDGSSLPKCASYQQTLFNYGKNITTNALSPNVMQKNASAMDASSDEVLAEAITSGKQRISTVTDEFINLLRGGLEDEIRKSTAGGKIDPLIISAIMAVEGKTDPSDTVKKYQSTQVELGIENPAIVIAAYKNGSVYITGNKEKKILRVDQVVREEENSSTGETEAKSFNLDWGQREDWLWVQFAEPYAINYGGGKKAVADLSFFPAVCYVYLQLLAYSRKSRFDGELFAFPFTEEQLKGVWFTSKYGMRQLSSESSARMHEGIDLATGAEGAGMQIHAIGDGVVVDKGGWNCNSITVEHADGYFSRYLHCLSHLVNVGQAVKKGDPIATVGDTGSPGAWHLHLEIGKGDAISERSQYDPCLFYPTLVDHFGDSPAPALGDKTLL